MIPSDLSLLPLLHLPLPWPADSAALSHLLLCAGAPGLSCASFCSIAGLQNTVTLVNITGKLRTLKVLLTGELLRKGICLPECGAAVCLCKHSSLDTLAFQALIFLWWHKNPRELRLRWNILLR